jgi:hypothetical protein
MNITERLEERLSEALPSLRVRRQSHDPSAREKTLVVAASDRHDGELYLLIVHVQGGVTYLHAYGDDADVPLHEVRPGEPANEDTLFAAALGGAMRGLRTAEIAHRRWASTLHEDRSRIEGLTGEDRTQEPS